VLIALQLTMSLVAHVTPAAIACDTSSIDFGETSVLESVVKTIKLTNLSALKQNFGFTDVPAYASVQPNDGFGTLLPFETISLDVIFRFAFMLVSLCPTPVVVRASLSMATTTGHLSSL
jgi:hypothetical protein